MCTGTTRPIAVQIALIALMVTFWTCKAGRILITHTRTEIRRARAAPTHGECSYRRVKEEEEM
jgi:hypothetical protein